MKIQILKFDKYNKKPFRSHYNDAGADVYSTEDVTISPHCTVKIPLGFGLRIPTGFMGCIFPRSSYACKGIISHIPPIDSGYTGEIHAIISNLTDEAFTIKEGDRVGQLVIMPIYICDFVEDLGEERGTNGFGSSGK